MPPRPPVQAEDLIIVGTAIRFRHPLIRSAIYYSAAPIERRRIHQALAAATDLGITRTGTHGTSRKRPPSPTKPSPPTWNAPERQSRAAGRAAFLTGCRRAPIEAGAPGGGEMAGAPGKAQLLLDRARDHLYDRLQDGLAKLAQGAIYHALDQPAQAAAVLVAAAADLATLDMRLARGPAGRAYGRGGLQARSRSTGRLPARSPRPPAPCRSGRDRHRASATCSSTPT